MPPEIKLPERVRVSSVAAFTVGQKILVLRLNRLAHIPPAQYGTEILLELGFPVLVVEFGQRGISEIGFFDREIPKIRLAATWTRFFPHSLKAALTCFWALQSLTIRILREGRPHFLIAHGIQEQWVAFGLAMLFRIPFAVHVHEIYNAKELSAFNRFCFYFEGFLMRKAVFLIFPGKERAGVYRWRYQLRCPIHIVYNCPRRRQKKTPLDYRKKLGLPQNTRLMVYMGGIGPANAIEEAVRALSSVPNLCFLLTGWCDTSYKKRLVRTARECGVDHRFFLLDMIPDRWQLLDGCDVSYCMYRPSDLRMQYNATASNKLTEALSAGLPVVVSPLKDFKELVHRYDIGVVADSYEPSSIAACLNQLLENEIAFKRKSQNALRCHEREFHYEFQFAKVVKTIRSHVPKTTQSEAASHIIFP